ncbi:MAG: MarR family transcriptional regulator [Nannocystaceae bacterium]|nr:MarR family transcriptional regulator [Nannocystaceae bacterium]
MSATRLHLLTERLSSLFRADMRHVASEHGLKLVQLEALVFLSMANRYSDTPVSLTEYFGLTKGTVSQTLKVLERDGLIEKHADARDGRVQHCAVTQLGATIVAEAFPAPMLSGAPTREDATLADALQMLLARLQQRNGLRTFGLCRSCRLFQTKGSGGVCGLTQESLTALDTRKICREHEATQGGC